MRAVSSTFRRRHHRADVSRDAAGEHARQRLLVSGRMASDEKPSTNLLALRDAREQAIAQLSDAFAHDLIEVDEFERRLTLAHRADTVAEVQQTVTDLTATTPSTALVPARAEPPVLANERKSARLLAIFGGVERHGPWTLPRSLQAFAIMGGIVLDFREALLLPGVTEVHVLALLGGAQIIVLVTGILRRGLGHGDHGRLLGHVGANLRSGSIPSAPCCACTGLADPGRRRRRDALLARRIGGRRLHRRPPATGANDVRSAARPSDARALGDFERA